MSDPTNQPIVKKLPGECVPWEEKKRELPPIVGDEQLVKKSWQDMDALTYTFIWQMLVSF